MKTEKAEVLVAGAGPVGLFAAVLLAEAGIEVQVIDREIRTTARSYACALHPRTLKLLDQLGLAQPLIAQGRRIPTVAFYDHAARRATLNFSELGGEFPFLLVLPQSALEGVLEHRLQQMAGRKVRWGHRLDRFEAAEDCINTTVEKLAGTAMGYIVPHWETMVQQEISIRAQFLIGADGHNSLVRQRLDLRNDRLGVPQSFVTCEFASETEVEPEVRIVLDTTTTNVLWPLPGYEYRWTFQLARVEGALDFPEKDRRAMPSIDKAINEQIREGLKRLIQQRAPWFGAAIGGISWCKQVSFEPRLVRRFGQGRCWLAGDSAHQTGPVGVQSLNVGLFEAKALADALRKILRDEAPLEILKAYDVAGQDEWRQLLGQAGGFWADSETSQWVRENSSRILPCLPASGEDLARIAAQLKLESSPASAPAHS
jgi:2-polyprenyl-6-methoxyphenol hydroxylase-like FAD-dependent oxidoreductase